MQLLSILALLPILASASLAVPLDARQSGSSDGWSVAFYGSESCDETPSITTTSSDTNYFDCQPAGSGPWANGTFFAAEVKADMYCHVKLFSDATCATQVGDEYYSEVTGCLTNPAAGFGAYSVSCYR
jgi:hypothetical protein